LEITASRSLATASGNLTPLMGVFSAPDPKVFYKYDGVLANRAGDPPSPRSDNKRVMSKHQHPKIARTSRYFRTGAELLQLPA